MEASLSPFALVFMLASMLAVTALMGWCYYRILFDKPTGDSARDADGPPVVL